MNNMETITQAVTPKTVNIPLHVEMTSVNGAPFEFTANIDEVGQIILTPTTQDVAFLSVETATTTEAGEEIFKQEETTIETDSSSMTFERKITTIYVTANMLIENEDNTDIAAVVNDFGQIVIYPLAKENNFVTASVNNSLNLITEAMTAVEEYCDGYKLINPGDGWRVRSPLDGRIIASGLDSLNDAKIFVCETEIKRLKSLPEELAQEKESKNTEESEEPEVTAEVIEEAVVTNKLVEFSAEEVKQAVLDITNNYKDPSGLIKCDTMSEGNICQRLLKDHYRTVNVDLEDGYMVINYSGNISLVEELDPSERMEVINRFAQGDIDAFEAEGSPLNSYIHLTELDSDKHEYYYDEDSDTIGVYKKVHD